MYFSTRAATLLACAAVVTTTTLVSASCPAPSTDAKDCIKVNSFRDFQSAVQDIGNGETLCFQPFSVAKAERSDHVVLEGENVHIMCQSPGACRIDGGGAHLRIMGTSTAATVEGFYFAGADDNAIQVMKNAGSRSGKEQNICSCLFEKNESNNKGAAIKFFENSKSYVENCDFRDNESVAGGAIMIHGAEVDLVSSYFEGNVAQVGGAISVEHDDSYESELTMKGCEFVANNAKGRGPAVYIDSRGGSNSFTDGGDNAGVDNELVAGSRGGTWDCNGIVHLTKRQCDKFDSTDVSKRGDIGDDVATNMAATNQDVWLNKPVNKPTNPPPTNPRPQPTSPRPQPTAALQVKTPTVSRPTYAKLAPTRAPTYQISDVAIEPSKVPNKPERGYYNYDDRSQYGPAKWSSVSARNTDEYDFWKEYDEYLKPDLTKNYCGATNKSKKRASPIDLNEKAINDDCLEYHEIRDKPGSFSLRDPKVDVEVLKDKLRIRWNTQSGWWDNIKGPTADIPKGWGDHYPVTHAELIMPSAHTLEGKRYAAEYQIWLMTNRGRGAPVISILVDIDPEDRDNWYFQVAIDAWQKVFDENQERCRRQRRGLRTTTPYHSNSTMSLLAPTPPEGERDTFDYSGTDDDHRRLQDRAWDPWHPNMVKSIWFWGYEGSTLTPPCYPFVEWRIIEKPMVISTKQHNQLKQILFGNVNGRCEPSSIHAKGGVASPPVIQNKGQSLHKCDCFDFLSDAFRKQNPRIRDCSDFKRGNAKPSWANDDTR